MGHYSTGGADCLYYIAGTYSHQGNCAVNIQANSGDASSFFHTNGINVDTPGYTQIKVDFWYYPLSMETGESFQVKYFDGSVWQTVASFVSGTNFDNNSFHYASVLIDEGTGVGKYNFPAGMKIKFQCVASSNTDDIYIDQVKVSAK
jgi:hypothetical protein